MNELERQTSLSLLARSHALADRATMFGLRERRPRILLSQRSWQLRWSRYGIAIGHWRYLSIEPHPIVRRPRVRRRYASSAALLLVCAVVGSAAIGMMANRDSGDTGHYLLSIDVPDRVPAQSSLPPPSVLADADKAMAVHPVASRARPQPEQSRPAVAAPAEDIQPEPDMAAASSSVPDGMFTAEGPAVAAALASGQFQRWQDAAHARRGFVVVDASEGGDDRTCRDLTILVRQDGVENNITKRHMCRAGAKGAWR